MYGLWLLEVRLSKAVRRGGGGALRVWSLVCRPLATARAPTPRARVAHAIVTSIRGFCTRGADAMRFSLSTASEPRVSCNNTGLGDRRGDVLTMVQSRIQTGTSQHI